MLIFVCLCGHNLYEALNLHLFGSDSLQEHSEIEIKWKLYLNVVDGA